MKEFTLLYMGLSFNREYILFDGHRLYPIGGLQDSFFNTPINDNEYDVEKAKRICELVNAGEKITEYVGPVELDDQQNMALEQLFDYHDIIKQYNNQNNAVMAMVHHEVLNARLVCDSNILKPAILTVENYQSGDNYSSPDYLLFVGTLKCEYDSNGLFANLQKLTRLEQELEPDELIKDLKYSFPCGILKTTYDLLESRADCPNPEIEQKRLREIINPALRQYSSG